MWGCAEFYLPFWPVKFLRKSLLLKCQASANQIMIFDTLLLTSFSVLAAIMRGNFDKRLWIEIGEGFAIDSLT